MKKLKVPRYIQWLALTGFIFLLLMTLLRVALVMVFQVPSSVSSSFLFNAFILGLRYDARMLCIVCVLVFLIGCIPALHPLEQKWGKRLSFWLWSIFIIVFAFFYAVDFANYAYLHQRMRAGILNYLDDAKISAGMVWQSYHVGWILLGLLVAVFLLLALIRSTYNYILSKPKYATKKSRLAWGIGFFIITGFIIFGKLGQYPLRWSDAYAFSNDYVANVALNPFQSFFSSLSYRYSSYDVDKVKKAYPWMATYLGVEKPNIDSLNYERVIIPVITNEIQPNVVIVICESFSGYKSSMYGNPLNTTPFFNQMCKNGIFFNRCFTPSFGTARGVWATVTGIPDVDFTNTSSRNPNAVDQHSIINDFKEYEKFYFIGGSTSWANIRGLLTNNIDNLHLYEQDDYNAPKIDVWGVSDKNLLLSANGILAKQRTPFFAVIQTADNHRPYTIPEEDRAAFKLNKLPKDSLLKYGFADEDEYNAFRYTDFCYQKFIEAARQTTYFKNTIFVFVGDHGIRGDAGDMFPHAWAEELSSEHVPLLFYAPALLKPKEYSFYSSQVDILPTIAGLCNLSYRNTSLGRDLLNSSRLSADSGKNNFAFIVDPDNKRIGVINNNFYYSYGIQNTSPPSILSVINNSKPVLPDSVVQQYKNITDAFYETSRYMLLNNKKKLK